LADNELELLTSAPMGAVARAAALSCDFRTFQVYPKDLRALPGHPEPAVSWHSGFRGGAHARHKTTPVGRQFHILNAGSETEIDAAFSDSNSSRSPHAMRSRRFIRAEDTSRTAASWATETASQAPIAVMVSFPNGKYRDQVDACSGAFNRLISGPSYNLWGGALD
jgi:hypothetical protein